MISLLTGESILVHPDTDPSNPFVITKCPDVATGEILLISGRKCLITSARLTFKCGISYCLESNIISCN